MTDAQFDSKLLVTAQSSYDRCCKEPDFFNEFFADFLGKLPAIPDGSCFTRTGRTAAVQEGLMSPGPVSEIA